VQGYSPLRAGLAFVPMPASVFIGSQLASRVLLRRLPEKAVMILGSAVAVVGLALATRVGAHTAYSQILIALVLIGAGSGTTLVALTSASLADVEPEIAGAASGLVNVSQQLGAAVGLAVLVTVFNSVAGHGGLVPGHTTLASVHALRDVFYVTVVFALGALATIVFGVDRSARAEATAGNGAPEEASDEFAVDFASLGNADVDADGQRPLPEAALSA
jgi:MFS family permease